MTDDKTVYTQWPPCETNEHEVLTEMRKVVANEGAAAAATYAYTHYIKGVRTRFASSEGNLLMAKLLLLSGDTVGFDDFRLTASASSDCTNQDKRQLLQMRVEWDDYTKARVWWPSSLRLKRAEQALLRRHPLI